MKAMFKKMVECEVEKWKRWRELLCQLVYSKDTDDYEDTKQEIYLKTTEQFRRYFEANWDSCQEIWVSYKRDHHVHLGNTTNNRLESHNQKLKDLTYRSSTLLEMFQSVRFSNTSASEYSHVFSRSSLPVYLQTRDLKVLKISDQYILNMQQILW